MKNPSLGTTCNRRCMWPFSLKWTDPTPVPTPPMTLLSSLEGKMSRHICVQSTLGSTWITSIEISILGTDPARKRKTLSSLPRTRWVTPPRSAALTPFPHPPCTTARLLCKGRTIPLICALVVIRLPNPPTLTARALARRGLLSIRLLYKAPLVTTQLLERTPRRTTLQHLIQKCPPLLINVKLNMTLTLGITLRVLLTQNPTPLVQGEPLSYGWAKLLRLLPTLKARSTVFLLSFLVR